MAMIVDCPQPDLSWSGRAFVVQLSQDSRCYSVEPAAFVSELHRRWSDRNPTLDQPRGTNGGESVSGGGTIFISYASEDIGAARALYAELQKISGDVAWFDKSVLKPGDQWERAILAGIQKCGLFLPLLSAETEQRSEGYFRLEWTEAAERSKRIEGRKFIVPVVIDPDYGRGPHASLDAIRNTPRFRALMTAHK
jgi:hypothetical protein